MNIPEVNQLCWCISLKTATTFGGFFGSLLDKGISCLIHHVHSWNIEDDSQILLTFIYVITAITFVTTLLMIAGSALEKSNLMRPFLAFFMIDIHVTNVLTYYGVYKLFKDDIQYGFIALGLSTIAVAFAIYYWIIVYSRYMEIYRAPDDAEVLLEN